MDGQGNVPGSRRLFGDEIITEPGEFDTAQMVKPEAGPGSDPFQESVCAWVTLRIPLTTFRHVQEDLRTCISLWKSNLLEVGSQPHGLACDSERQFVEAAEPGRKSARRSLPRSGTQAGEVPNSPRSAPRLAASSRKRIHACHFTALV
jgi:hypothetical protein